jgi:hypothetical protein
VTIALGLTSLRHPNEMMSLRPHEGVTGVLMREAVEARAASFCIHAGGAEQKQGAGTGYNESCEFHHLRASSAEMERAKNINSQP